MSDAFGVGHPTSLELTDLVDGGDGGVLGRGAAVRAHVADCAECLAHLLGTTDLDVVARTTLADGTVPQVEISQASQASWHSGTAPEAAFGQLWLIGWDEMSALAAVVEAGDLRLSLAPVTDLDTDFTADDLVEVAPAESPLGVGLAVWTSRTVEASVSCLHAFLGAFEDLHAVPSAPPVTSTAHWSVEAAASIAMQSMRWMPEVGTADDAALTGGIQAWAADHGLSFSQLADWFGPEPALSIWRDRPPSTEEAQRISSELGIPPEAFESVVVAPASLLRLVSDPARKEPVQRQALRKGVSEGTLRRHLVMTALAPAARTSHAQNFDVVDRWRAILDHELAE